MRNSFGPILVIWSNIGINFNSYRATCVSLCPVSIVELFDEGGSGISVLRSFRLLRIFKLVRFMPALQRQLLVMIHTMDNVVTFLALLALFIFTASILGMHLFGGKYSFPDEHGNKTTARANFDDLFWAVVTVFQVSVARFASVLTFACPC